MADHPLKPTGSTPLPTLTAAPGQAQSFDRQKTESELRQWPVQLMLVPTHASYFTDSDLAITADCVPFAHGNFHREFLRGRPLVVGCPKLDFGQVYVDKLAEIFALHNLK